MKKVITILGLFGLILVQAQVGINKDKPDATLDIVAEKTDGSQVEGLLLPRISKKAAHTMAGNTNLKESTLVYIDNTADYTTTPVATSVADITEKGYYFWSGSKWELVNTSGNSIWKKDTDGTVSLKRANSNDVMEYTPAGYRFFDKSVNQFKSFNEYANRYDTYNLADSAYIYSYEQYLLKNMVNKNTGAMKRLTGKHIDGMVTADDTNSGYGMALLDIRAGVDADNTNDYRAMTSLFASTNHHGKGKVSWVRGAYLDGAVTKQAKANLVIGSHMLGMSSSDYLVNEVYASRHNATIRGAGSVNYLIGAESRVGPSKATANSPAITGNVKQLMGLRSIIDTRGSDASFGVIMTGTIKNAYGNRIQFWTRPETPITNAYGLYVDNLPTHTTADNYAIYTNTGKVRFGDNVGIGVDAPAEKLEVSGKIKAANVIFTGIPTYANDAAAATGGLVAGEMYKTSTGELRIKL